MSKYEFSRKFELQNEIYSKYEKRANNWIFVNRVSNLMVKEIILALGIFIVFQLPFVPITVEWYTLSGKELFTYVLMWITSLCILLFPFLWGPSRFFVSKYRQDFDYEMLDVDFIWAYRALNNYDSYRETENRSYLEQSIKSIKKTFEEVNKWSYNVPLINQDTKKQLSKLQELRNKVIQIIKSTSVNENTAHNILYLLTKFINAGSQTSLIELLEKTQSMDIPYRENIISINTKNKLKLYFEHHKIRSQLVFSLIWCLLIGYIGWSIGIPLNQLFTTVLSVGIIGSISLFNMVKDWLDTADS